AELSTVRRDPHQALRRSRVLRHLGQGRRSVSTNSFDARGTLSIGARLYEILRLAALEQRGLAIAKLPYSLKILLENLLRLEDGRTVTAGDVEKLPPWGPGPGPESEKRLLPARALQQDFTRLPAGLHIPPQLHAMAQWAG